MHGIDWSDLQVFAAIAEGGSIGGAARTLNVNHTTIARRIHALESQLGVRLFRRLKRGYVLTPAGEELRAEIEGVHATLANVERRLAGRDARLSGALRVSTTDTLALSILMPPLQQFRERHPEVALTVSTSNALANLSRRDADVVIRPARSPGDALVGSRIGKVGFAIYSNSKARSDPWREGPWIALDDSLADTSVGRWFRSEMTRAPIALRVDSFVSARDAALHGIGVAALPCYLGDRETRLHRVTDPLPALATELWVLTHADSRTTLRVMTFMRFMSAALRAQRAAIAGA